MHTKLNLNNLMHTTSVFSVNCRQDFSRKLTCGVQTYVIRCVIGTQHVLVAPSTPLQGHFGHNFKFWMKSSPVIFPVSGTIVINFEYSCTVYSNTICIQQVYFLLYLIFREFEFS